LVRLGGLQAGCSALSSRRSCESPPPTAFQSVSRATGGAPAAVQQASFQEAHAPCPGGSLAPLPSPSFAGMPELSVGVLIQEVLARNPTLAQMVAAWQAA